MALLLLAVFVRSSPEEEGGFTLLNLPDCVMITKAEPSDLDLGARDCVDE
jgi:hypothetical protein